MQMITKKLSTLKAFSQITGERIVSLPQSSNRLGLICGGSGNLGDDAMVEAAHFLLPHAKLIRFEHPKQEHRLMRMGLSGQRYFHSMILGGGTLICPTWRKQVQAALQQELLVWSLGTGVGSNGFNQPTEVEIREWKALLMDFHRLGVRGPRSKTALEAIGIDKAEVIGDLALSLTCNELMQPCEPPCFAVNITVPTGQTYDDGEYTRLQELEPILQTLIQQGWQPLPIAMHASDLPPLRQLMHRVSMEHLPIHVVSTPDEFFQLVAPCSFTIAVRLHAAVLSCCVGVPPLMLGYRDKCLDFMQSMQLEDWHVGLQTAEAMEIPDKVQMLSERSTTLRIDVLKRAQAWRQTLKDYVVSTVPQFV